MTEKIKILFLAANSLQERQDCLQREVREIKARMRLGEHRDAFELISHWAVRTSDLQEILLEHQPHIVHFSGRGTKNQGIILENDIGQTRTISEDALTGLFRLLKDNIRIIVFNACYTDGQAAALAQIIDYAIGISQSVEADTAMTFSAFFYQALAFGRSVKDAFDLAITQLMLEKVEEYKKPFFKPRPGVDTSKSFLKQIKQTGSSSTGNHGWPFQPISAALRQRCRELFEICDEFSSPDNLRAFFYTVELRPFAHCVRRSANLDFDQLISCLQNSGHERPGLLDLLEQLESRYKRDYRGQVCEDLKEDYAKEVA
jgi:hypothetical protein